MAVTFSQLPSVLLKEPIRHFFWMANQMGRVQAERDLCQFRLITMGGGMADGAEELVRTLQKERGEIYHWGPESGATITLNLDDQMDPEFDRSALHALTARHRL